MKSSRPCAAKRAPPRFLSARKCPSSSSTPPAKSTAKVSQRKEVSELVINAPGDFLELVQQAESDIVDAGAVLAIVYVEAPELSIAVTLAPDADN